MKQGFFWLILEVGSVTSSSKKMGKAAPYANKKWVACSKNKTVFNNHETHTTCM